VAVIERLASTGASVASRGLERANGVLCDVGTNVVRKMFAKRYEVDDDVIVTKHRQTTKIPRRV